MTRALHVALLALSLALFGALSVALRQDNNWDLRNYHYYIPYAFLTGRSGFDVGPASIQTFLNPFLDVPFYLLIEHVRPQWVGFTLGAIQGLNFWLAFEIAWLAWKTRPGRGEESWVTGSVFSLVCAGLGLYAAGSAPELGTTFHDLTLAPLVLGSLAILLRAASRPAAARSFLAAGVLLGCAVGLKPTAGIYVPSMAAALLAGTDSRWGDRVRALAQWVVGLAAGILLTGGYWAYTLYARFGTPLAPYFNNVFRSPYFPAEANLDERFFPKTHLQWLFYPFYFNGRTVSAMESPFQDVRWAVLYVLVVVTAALLLVARLRRRRRPSPAHLPAGFRILLVFAVVSYVVWEFLFSIYRYLVALEVLCPVLIYLCLCVIVSRDSQVRLALCFSLFVLIAAAVRLPAWGRVPWSDSFFGTRAPRMPPNALVLMEGTPTAFVIPAFPKDARFVRIDGLFGADRATSFRDVIGSLVRSHSGDFYLLWQRLKVTDPARYLNPYGLRADLETCEPVTNRADPDIVLCRVSRMVTQHADRDGGQQ